MDSKEPSDCSNGSLPTKDSSSTTNSSSSTEKALLPPTRQNGISATLTLANFAKGMIGPGCLSLPIAFKQAGLWTAFALIFIFGFLNNYCMLQLVHCSQYLCSKYGCAQLDYGNVAYEAFAQSFNWLKPKRRIARMCANAAILSLQLGVCCISYVFITEHLQQIVEEIFHIDSIAKSQYMFMILLPLIAVNCIRQLRTIAFFNVFGHFLMAGAIGIVFYQLFQSRHNTWDLPWITDFNGVMTACGTILYAFEGQAMVLPLENKLKHSSDMVGATGVLSTGMSFVTLIYAAIGFYGFLTYGEDIKGSIALNLPDKTVFIVVKGLLIGVAYVGYSLQQYIIIEMVWPWIRDTKLSRASNKTTVIFEYLFRAGLVVLAMAIALAVPHLETIISFVGITSGMFLAFILPATIDTVTFLPLLLKEQEKRGRLRIYRRLFSNAVLCLIGFFGLIAGLQANIRDIIKPNL